MILKTFGTTVVEIQDRSVQQTAMLSLIAAAMSTFARNAAEVTEAVAALAASGVKATGALDVADGPAVAGWVGWILASRPWVGTIFLGFAIFVDIFEKFALCRFLDLRAEAAAADRVALKSAISFRREAWMRIVVIWQRAREVGGARERDGASGYYSYCGALRLRPIISHPALTIFPFLPKADHRLDDADEFRLSCSLSFSPL